MSRWPPIDDLELAMRLNKVRLQGHLIYNELKDIISDKHPNIDQFVHIIDSGSRSELSPHFVTDENRNRLIHTVPVGNPFPILTRVVGNCAVTIRHQLAFSTESQNEGIAQALRRRPCCHPTLS